MLAQRLGSALGSAANGVVLGKDGHGETLTPQQIKTALKIQQQAMDEENEFDDLALQIGFDPEQRAQEIINLPSPTGSRQIVSRINKAEA